MGNFLDTPKTDKETQVGQDDKKCLSYGLSAMQGWRAQMEDDHVQELNLAGVRDPNSFSPHHANPTRLKVLPLCCAKLLAPPPSFTASPADQVQCPLRAAARLIIIWGI
jgi:hypothetical protein